jgi:hypothetical protein
MYPSVPAGISSLTKIENVSNSFEISVQGNDIFTSLLTLVMSN